VQKLTAAELEVAIQNRTVPVVIDFYATWCGPCLLMAQELLKVAEQLQDKVQILKVDTDEEQELSSQLKIEGLPTLLFLSPDTSKKALRLEGMIPAEQVIKIITEEL